MMVTPSTSSKIRYMQVQAKTHQEGLLQLGKLVLSFAKVKRVTLHEDGDTPESDTDHTVMVAVIACSLAEALYAHELDRGKVAEFAIVHDMVEAYTGDVNTFGIQEEDVKKKEHSEARALHLIEDQFSAIYPWLPKTITEYESLATKEARFVKTVDKMMTMVTNSLNGGAYFIQRRMKREIVEQHYREKIQKAEKSYGAEFPLIIHFMNTLMEDVVTTVYGKIH